MKITRDVISDLWPLYAAGEATDDTRRLVEHFLVDDPEFRTVLRQRFDMPAENVSLPPDHEARALARTRELIRGGGWLRGVRLVAIVLSVLALFSGKLVDGDTYAMLFQVILLAWLLYALLHFRLQGRALGEIRPRNDPPRH